MPIWASTKSNYVPAPAGAHAAVCVDVVDLGELEVTYSGKTKSQHKIKIVWQIDEERESGKPYSASKRYSLSLHEKATLRKDLESWRGKPFTDEELQGFDVEVLLNKPCMINVIHAVRDGSTYANITGVMRLPKGMQAPTARDYVRECEREPAAADAPATVEDYGQEPPWSDDVPF